RGHHPIAGAGGGAASVGQAGEDGDCLVVAEGAAQRDGAEVEVVQIEAGPLADRRHLHRWRIKALVDGCNQRFLIGQTLQLPDAEPDADSGQQQHQHHKCAGHDRSKATTLAHWRPSWASWRYCRATSTPLKGGNSASDKTIVAGIHSIRWTKGGRLKSAPTTMASTTMTGATRKMTKTAGPSPLSAKDRSSPHTVHFGASLRYPLKDRKSTRLNS